MLGDPEPGPGQHAVIMFIVVRHRTAVDPPLLHILTSGSGPAADAVSPGSPGPFLGNTDPGPDQHAVVVYIVVRHRSAVVPPLLHILTSGSGAEAAAVGPGYPGPFLGDTETGPGQHAVIMIIVFVPSLTVD